MTTELKDKAAEAGLVVREQKGGAMAVATGQHRVEGLENIDDKELAIGSLILVQAAAIELINKGFRAGDIVNSATEKKVDDATFIPVYMTKFWSLYDNSGATPKWVSSSPNENDPAFTGKLRVEDITKEMRAKKIKAEVIPVLYVVALLDGQPVKISFKKAAGYYAGKDLYTAICRQGGFIGDAKYKLSSKLNPAKGDNPAYYALKVEKVGETTQDERNFARQLKAAVMKKKDEVQPVDAEESVPF